MLSKFNAQPGLKNSLFWITGAGLYVLVYSGIVVSISALSGWTVPILAVARLVPLGAALYLIFPYQSKPAGGKGFSPGKWDYLIVGFILWTAGLSVDALFSFIAPAAFVPVRPGSLFLAAGYPAFLLGCWRLTQRTRPFMGSLRAVLDILVTCLALTTLIGIFLVNPAVHQAAINPAGLFWSSIFATLDLGLFFAIFYLILVNDQKNLQVLLGALLVGCLASTWSDTAATYLFLGYIPGLDWTAGLGWVVGSLMFFLGIVLAEKKTDAGQPASPKTTLALRVSQILPIAATAALVWYVLLDWQLRNHFYLVGAVISVVCIFLLILRQGVSAGEAELQEFAMLVNSVAEPAFILDQRGCFKLVNPALLTCIGRPNPDGLVGQALNSFFDVEPVEPDWLAAALAGGWAAEIELRSWPGQDSQAPIPVYLSLQPFQRQGSRQAFLAGTAHDLSEQKRQQNALRRAHQQLAVLNEGLEQKVEEKTRSLSEAYARLEQQNQTLQQLDELKTDFVSLVSHELRAPLTNISGGIELVLSSPNPLPERTQQSLGLVQAEIIRLNHFVKTILDVSALDAGHLPVYPAPISLEQTLEKLRSQLAGVPGSERIVWQLHAPLPFVLADENALASIFFHLIDNALKYAPEGKIEVVVAPGEDCVTASIDDEGPGIPEEAMPLLFDKFYRLHKGDAQTVYGHGLGLYMVRRLLQAMNGDIRAANRPGGGASFLFWLPTPDRQEIDGP